MKFTPMLAWCLFGLAGRAVAVEPPPTDVVMIDHVKVDGAFAQGLPLAANSSYKILAGRRVAPGQVEVHAQDTDIIYVVEGAATFVTGGTVVDGKSTGPGEIRGKETTGGVTRHLVKGDVIIVPKGIPHWFTEVSGTFLYFVVKVTG